jgi:hypothetical protein
MLCKRCLRNGIEAPLKYCDSRDLFYCDVCDMVFDRKVSKEER